MSAGGVALGGGVATKAAAVIAAVIAGGASFEAVNTTVGAHRTAAKPASQPLAIAAAIPIGGPAVGVHPSHPAPAAVRAAKQTRSKPHAAATPAAVSPDATVSTLPAATPAAPGQGGSSVDAAAAAAAPQPQGLLRRRRAHRGLPTSGVLPLPSLPLAVPKTPAVPTVTAPTPPSLPAVPAAPAPPALPEPPLPPGPPAVPPLPDPPVRPPLP